MEILIWKEYVGNYSLCKQVVGRFIEVSSMFSILNMEETVRASFA